jgi:Protein of unknown function (DUF3352)
MSEMRATALALLMGLALVAGGCGGDSSGAAADGAEIVPASAAAFVSIDSNLGSDQWQAADELLKAFPGRSQFLYALTEQVTDSDLDYERDIEPALGDELDLVWLDFEEGDDVVGITKPKDEAALKRLVEKANASDDSGDDLFVGEVSGWSVLSSSQASLDRFREQAQEGPKLADDDLYEDALAELPDAALVKAYVRGERLRSALRELTGSVGTVLQLGQDQQPEFLAAALGAEDEGFRLNGVSRAAQEPVSQPEAFESKLIEDVPGDAVAFLTFKGGDFFDRQLQQLNSNPLFSARLKEFEREVGFPLQRLVALFENEVALYVRPTTPLPELTLLLEAPNEQAARTTIDLAIAAVTRTRTAQPCHAPLQPGIKCVELDDDFALSYGVFDGKAVFTTGADGISKLRSDDERLPDAADFTSSRDAAGLPEEVPGFLWLDLEESLPMIFGLAEATDNQVPPAVRANLEPLRSVYVWGELDGRTSSFSAFLQID